MAAGSSSSVQKKSQRPVLPSHVAHAHAFAVVPTPGNPSSAKTGSSYFLLSAPPAPLRAFTLLQAEMSTRGTEGDATTYPASVSSSQQDENSIVEKWAEQPRSADAAPRRSSGAVEPSSKTYAHSSTSISGATPLQFATAAPFGVNDAGSPYMSSSGSHSARSALSITEIDCSNDETSDMWTSDRAERERQRAERQACMRARKEAKEELRMQRRLARVGAADELSVQTEPTWRETIRSQGTPSSDDVPATRARVRKRAATMDSTFFAAALGRAVAPAVSADTPTPSGPSPPGHARSNPASADTLANDLTTSLTLPTLPSEILENPQPRDTTPGDPPSAPVLDRFDSGETEIGAPSRPAEA
ncbi:hypothetical protein FRC10_008532 [Ceratobasidium sp. 414]|nr:hypothetical protein FRC10_008532 [Ceratobasidium sp. 414]